MQILQIFYTFVLRAEICTTFEPKVVQTSAGNTRVYKICEIWRIYVPHFKTFRDPTLQFTICKTLFLTVAMDFVLPSAQIKI